MAIARQFQGNFSSQVPYAGPQIWGTGYNPIHATRDGDGRNVAPTGKGNLVDPQIVGGDYDGETDSDQFGYTADDSLYQTFDANESKYETGTADRPELGINADLSRGDTGLDGNPYPGWNQSGTLIRSVEKGGIASNTPTATPQYSAAAGYLSKQTDGVIEPGSGISDPVQYVMQTSMQQLHRTREGSQSSGTASVYTQPIKTRVPGQKIAGYSGGYRHAAMRPRQQTGIPWRPFFYRTAGTGRLIDMKPNVPINNSPLTRVPAPDPYQGPTVQSLNASVTNQDYGYVPEDAVY